LLLLLLLLLGWLRLWKGPEACNGRLLWHRGT
jgi:hypothetical protein